MATVDMTARRVWLSYDFTLSEVLRAFPPAAPGRATAVEVAAAAGAAATASGWSLFAVEVADAPASGVRAAAELWPGSAEQPAARKSAEAASAGTRAREGRLRMRKISPEGGGGGM
ncbi:hypothetical protein O1M63_48025 [Streptomyces mirabilis]|nr:hypothetical protein [Streptomyces mirabilis]